VRVPLVDVQLLNRLASIKIRNEPLSKRLLASSPRVPLPPKVIRRAKTGFGTPIDDWLQSDNRIKGWRRVPTLAAENCAWARRWAFQLAAA
jgi:hypothetical protein